MKNFKISTVTTIAVYAMLAVVFSSCERENSKRVVTGPTVTQNYEDIVYPVRLQYIERNGMKYMIASGHWGESGPSICNLTLDSLQVEFYRRSLK